MSPLTRWRSGSSAGIINSGDGRTPGPVHALEPSHTSDHGTTDRCGRAPSSVGTRRVPYAHVLLGNTGVPDRPKNAVRGLTYPFPVTAWDPKDTARRTSPPTVNRHPPLSITRPLV